MFEVHYNEEMAAEVLRLEARRRAEEAGHPEWENACSGCGARLTVEAGERCAACGSR